MTKYQLAKLILMAGGLPSRKRVQKTVHLLQAAGCPFGLDFRLHYYGPYSAELAGILDRMTSGNILEETAQQTTVGTQYDYRFSEEMRESLESFEQTPAGQTAREEIERHQGLLTDLCATNSRVLELASTTVAFYMAGRNWDDAVKETADFKSESTDSRMMTEALELAQTVVGYDDG
ncbi:MAG: hypothetical protein HQ582_10350 [Planctomycetes bacterium]|nr:hypothetical protein [Planctomycetota bacterium]